MSSLSDAGELAERPLPRLLLDLHAARFEGTLRLRRDHIEKSFCFQDGAPISSESSLASETLGLLLVDRGRLSREELHRVSSYVVERGVREGVALLELGLLDPKGLFRALKEQVRARLVDCFGWPRGEFALEPGAAAHADAQPFRADVFALVQEGIAAHWSADRVLADLAPRMEHNARRNRLLSRLQERLQGDESVDALIDSLDGSRTLWRALQDARSPRALAAAWLFDAIGALDYGAAPERGGAASADQHLEIVVGGRAGAQEPAARAAEAAPAAPGRGMDQVLALEISQKYVVLGEIDHYALLGVEQDAAPDAIRRAYYEAAKHYHPDALARAGLDRETRQKAGRVFAAIGKAHAVLSDPKRRRGYDASLACDESDLDAERLAAAETHYRKGEILMRQGNFRGALDFLRPAVELWPEDGTYRGSLGWALFKASPPDPIRARQQLERAYELEPRNAQVAFWLSHVLKALGERAPAANLLAKARELDPRVG